MRRSVPPPPPPPQQGVSPSSSPVTVNNSNNNSNSNMQSPHLRMSTIPVQSSYASFDVQIPEPPQTEAGKWTFHSQRDFPPPPPFEKKLRRYPTGAESGCCKHIYIDR